MWNEEGTTAVTAGLAGDREHWGAPAWAREVRDPALGSVLEELAAGRAGSAVEKARALLRNRETSEGQVAGRRLALGVALARSLDAVAGDSPQLREAVRILADAAAWA